MSGEVESRQEAVDAIHAEVFADRIARRGQSRTNGTKPHPLNLDDSRIIELASNAKNADHFLSLFRDGDVSRYGGDDSAADLALASMLAFWTGGNAAQIEAIFSQSTLAQRSKWGRPDYRQRTIATALERTTEFYGASSRTQNMNNHTAAAGTGNSNTTPCVVLTPMSEFEAEDIEWLWPDRFAIGKFHLLVGDPDNCKSWLSLEIAAHVSAGTAFPDGAPCKAGGVVLIADEDGAADTIRPRLDAQCAETTRIHKLKIRVAASERQFSLSDHLDLLKEKLREINQAEQIRLLIIDPVSAYLGEVDSNKDSQVREILTPLAALADEMRIAIIGVMHLNKSAVLDIIYRVTGSIGFVGQARTAWAVVEDPNQSGRRLFLKLKNNLARADISGLAFTIQENEQGRPRLEWESEPVTQKLRDVMGGFSNQKRGPKGMKLEEAVAWLYEQLKDGRKHFDDEVEAAAKVAHISVSTYIRAKKKLRDKGELAKPRPDDFSGRWQIWLVDAFFRAKQGEAAAN